MEVTTSDNLVLYTKVRFGTRKETLLVGMKSTNRRKKLLECCNKSSFYIRLPTICALSVQIEVDTVVCCHLNTPPRTPKLFTSYFVLFNPKNEVLTIQ